MNKFFEILYLHRCIEIPTEETCLSLIPYTHYAPDTFEFTEELSNEFNQIIERFEPFNPCRTIILGAICVYRYPACNATTGLLLPVCTEICPDVMSAIRDCSLESFDYVYVSQTLNAFDCTQPQTYFTEFPSYYIETDPDECAVFGKHPLMCI